MFEVFCGLPHQIIIRPLERPGEVAPCSCYACVSCCAGFLHVDMFVGLIHATLGLPMSHEVLGVLRNLGLGSSWAPRGKDVRVRLAHQAEEASEHSRLKTQDKNNSSSSSSSNNNNSDINNHNDDVELMILKT